MEKKLIVVTLLFLLFSMFAIQSITTGSIDSKTEENKNLFGYEATEPNETKPQGGILRVGSKESDKIWGLNPLIAEGLGVQGYNVAKLPLFSRLLRLNETGLMSPDLAKSWNVSHDGLEYTFFLYINVTWHDSVDFNASDV